MAYHGKKGNLVFNGNLANLESFTLTRIGETANATAMGDTWDVFIAGLTDFNASAEGKSQVGLDTVALLGTSQAATEFVMQDAGAEYTAGAIMTGITETATVDDIITLSYTFEGNDPAGLVFGGAGTAPTPSANTIHGKHLQAQHGVSTAFADITGWTMTMSTTVSDATVADATNVGRQKLAGTNTATATVTVLTPVTTIPITEGDEQALKLSRSATVTDGSYSGTAICSGVEMGVDRSGVENTTYTFTFTGVVTFVTA